MAGLGWVMRDLFSKIAPFVVDHTLFGNSLFDLQGNPLLCGRAVSIESAHDPPSIRSSFLCRD